MAVLLAWTGCRTPSADSALQRFQFNSSHMGTMFTVTLHAADEASAKRASKAAFARVAALDRTLSDYDPESELMRLRKQPIGQPAPVSEDLFNVLSRAAEISRRTDGAFDMTVGPMVHLWRTARKSRILPAPEEIAEVRAAVGYEKVKLDSRKQTVTLLARGMRLDPGGIGKGYAADEALKTLRQHGITRALVAASGDIAIGDAPPGKKGWTVGIGAPEKGDEESVRNVSLRNCGVSTSGDTEQFVEIGGARYSHIVNPKTGVGLTERIQVTVIAPDATTSDSLATAVSVLGVKSGVELIESFEGTEVLIFCADDGRGSSVSSPTFPQR